MIKLKVLNDTSAASSAPAPVTAQQPLRVGLVALNWEVNTSLALWNLELFARKDPRIDQNVKFSQYCSAMPKSYPEGELKLFELLRWIRENDFHIVGFSCYVWNVQFINRVAKAMRKLMPDKKIVYGGQQIRGFYIRHLFEKEQCVDVCVEDEGEISFRELLLHYLTGAPALADVPGLTYLDANNGICRSGPPKVLQDLNEIPSPYLGDVALPEGGAFLIEASRGCPYKCSFCIWGEAESVREYDIDRVEKELEHLFSKKPKHIKFCDGTFNLKKDRVLRMLGFMVEKLRSGEAEPFNGLFEIRLELIDHDVAKVFDEFISLNPLFTLEFGLQTVNKTSSKMMQRPFFEARFRKAWETLTPRLRSLAVLDCIYGLPGDTREDFFNTVDFAYSLAPHVVQCFRLSVLPGSQFERSAEEFGFKYSDEPDHTVFETKWVSLDQMEWLEAFGVAVVDIYHFHRTTVACLLGAGSRFPSFSALLADFVDQQGSRKILECLYGNARPEGRWRAIDLSACFTGYVLGRALAELGVSDVETRQKFVELLRYESMLGAMAIHSISSEDDAGECLIPNAQILKSCYDIPGFLAEARDMTVADIGRLATRSTTMALTQKQSLGGVKMPISYRISDALADVLSRFKGGRTTTEVVAELGEKSGNEKAWHSAIASLRARKLLVGASEGAAPEQMLL
jgi:tRNA A37 methylthiotransferase MiaB